MAIAFVLLPTILSLVGAPCNAPENFEYGQIPPVDLIGKFVCYLCYGVYTVAGLLACCFGVYYLIEIAGAEKQARPHSMDYPPKHEPEHLGLRCNALPEHQTALIISGCVPFRLHSRYSWSGAGCWWWGCLQSWPHTRSRAR